MSIFEHYGTIMLLRHEGNQQFASALAGGVQTLLRRLPRLLSGPHHRTPTASSS